MRCGTARRCVRALHCFSAPAVPHLLHKRRVHVRERQVRVIVAHDAPPA